MKVDAGADFAQLLIRATKCQRRLWRAGEQDVVHRGIGELLDLTMTLPTAGRRMFSHA
jgi:hypothetical protein